MPDLVDRAQAVEEQLAALEVRRPVETGPRATGVCLYCGAPLPDGMRWCGSECRDEWEHLDAILQRRGL